MIKYTEGAFAPPGFTWASNACFYWERTILSKFTYADRRNFVPSVSKSFALSVNILYIIHFMILIIISNSPYLK